MTEEQLSAAEHKAIGNKLFSRKSKIKINR